MCVSKSCSAGGESRQAAELVTSYVYKSVKLLGILRGGCKDSIFRTIGIQELFGETLILKLVT